MVQIAFLRRLLRLNQPEENVELPAVVAAPPPEPPAPTTVSLVACPSCGVALDPPPTHARRCPRCRRQIVVRHSEGRAIYLTEAAVEVFESERQREIDEQAWARQRRRWLQLAGLVGVRAARRRQVEAAPLTAAAVTSARTLYMVAAERAVRTARREKRWDEVAIVRRRQAAALFEESGGGLPLSDEIVAVHREGVAATLRALTVVSREAELVGSSCCSACRTDSERIFGIADELRTPRLPHAGCPRGLCACDWWPAVRKVTRQRRRSRAVVEPPAPNVGGDEPT